MAKVIFTPNIQRHVVCPDAEAAGRTVREVLENVFAQNPQARAYVLDDQSGLRRHMTIFVDGRTIRDRADRRRSNGCPAGRRHPLTTACVWGDPIERGSSPSSARDLSSEKARQAAFRTR